MPPASRLTLIGTIHRDPHGCCRLRALLEQLQPSRLTLEMSPAALQFRQRQGPLQLERLERILRQLAAELERPLAVLEAHPAVSDIRSLLALPFEYRAAAGHASRTGIPLALIDDSQVAGRKLSRVRHELLSLRNLRILLRQPERPQSSGEEGVTVARALLERDPGEALREAFLARRRGAEGLGPRDRAMAATIRAALQDGAGEHLVHIGGWVHLVEDPQGETLYSLLADLAPHRLLLAPPGTSMPDRQSPPGQVGRG